MPVTYRVFISLCWLAGCKFVPDGTVSRCYITGRNSALPRDVSRAGALVGPPWSTRENGYVLSETVPGGIKLYYEPHCDFKSGSVEEVGQVDVVVTPPTSQVVLGFPLVSSPLCLLGGALAS